MELSGQSKTVRNILTEINPDTVTAERAAAHLMWCQECYDHAGLLTFVSKASVSIAVNLARYHITDLAQAARRGRMT
jgi:hypothetical protein